MNANFSFVIFVIMLRYVETFIHNSSCEIFGKFSLNPFSEVNLATPEKLTPEWENKVKWESIVQESNHPPFILIYNTSNITPLIVKNIRRKRCPCVAGGLSSCCTSAPLPLACCPPPPPPKPCCPGAYGPCCPATPDNCCKKPCCRGKRPPIYGGEEEGEGIPQPPVYLYMNRFNFKSFIASSTSITYLLSTANTSRSTATTSPTTSTAEPPVECCQPPTTPTPTRGNKCGCTNCDCGRPCCYYRDPTCCNGQKPCCPPQKPYCPPISSQCCHSAPPCLRACPTCPCRKRIFLGTRVKRQNGLDNLLGLHCLPCPAAINDGEPEVKAKKPKNTARDVVEEALKAAKVKLFSNSIQNAKRCVKRDGEKVQVGAIDFCVGSKFHSLTLRKYLQNKIAHKFKRVCVLKRRDWHEVPDHQYDLCIETIDQIQ